MKPDQLDFNQNDRHVGDDLRPRAFLRAAMDAVLAVLCALACFPRTSFGVMHNWGDKIQILTRGISVAISPAVATMALLQNATAVFGKAGFVIVLPFIAFVVDWSIVARSYGGFTERKSGFWFGVLRFGLAMISLCVATYASLLGDEAALRKNLDQHEVQAAMQVPDVAKRYELFGAQITDLQAAIPQSQQQLRNRGALVRERALKTKLADKECNGAPGVDAESGITIIGGQRCGERAFSYRADVAAAQAQIDEIDALPGRIAQMKADLADAELAREALFKPHRSASDTPNSLFKALAYADFSLLAPIAFKVTVLMFVELFALIYAHTEVSQNVLLAVRGIETEDTRRIANRQKVTLAEVDAQNARDRSRHGAALPPMIIRPSRTRPINPVSTDPSPTDPSPTEPSPTDPSPTSPRGGYLHLVSSDHQESKRD